MTSSRLVLSGVIGLCALCVGRASAVADVAIFPIPERATGGEEWIGLAAARVSSGILAVWSQRHAWLSRDDGRSFAAVLEGKATISAAVVGAEGDFYVARGAHL